MNHEDLVFYFFESGAIVLLKLDIHLKSLKHITVVLLNGFESKIVKLILLHYVPEAKGISILLYLIGSTDIL